MSLLDNGWLCVPRHEVSQEGVADDTLGMTINVGGPEQGLVGDLGKLFMLKLSHIVHHYSQVFALKTQPEICFMDINMSESFD